MSLRFLSKVGVSLEENPDDPLDTPRKLSRSSSANAVGLPEMEINRGIAGAPEKSALKELNDEELLPKSSLRRSALRSVLSIPAFYVICITNIGVTFCREAFRDWGPLLFRGQVGCCDAPVDWNHTNTEHTSTSTLQHSHLHANTIISTVISTQQRTPEEQHVLQYQLFSFNITTVRTRSHGLEPRTPHTMCNQQHR
jgi:hypothetical protein